MFNDISRLGKYLGQAARLMVDYKAFFRERQEARYGGKGGPKCC